MAERILFLTGHLACARLEKVLAAAGDTGPALDELERRLSRPAFFSVEMLKLDPRWDAIRKEPRFQALIAQYGSR